VHYLGHFDSKAMPSAGLLPFFQSMFCAANNTCYKTERPSEQPGVVSSFNTSLYVPRLDIQFIAEQSND